MLVLAADGTLLRVNDTLAALLGRAPEELIGRRTLDITHPEDADVTLTPLAQLAEGENTVRFTKRYLRADGSAMWGEVTATAVRDDAGGHTHTIAFIQDVTEQMCIRDRHQTARASLSRLRPSIYPHSGFRYSMSARDLRRDAVSTVDLLSPSTRSYEPSPFGIRWFT